MLGSGASAVNATAAFFVAGAFRLADFAATFFELLLAIRVDFLEVFFVAIS